ncbi:sugar porter family MFS transporter [Rhodanobacter sp. MP1X3]|uniref:sugar porter family MFS transporter n=1 Tax=unclassified Rhodanobacter TaxID=2621553 RepID=UPI00180F7FC0|nr:sugar porter (SP) family MFS transporter [Rhodanobacter sp. MP1X3]MBB6245187.1 sugar porter (SP) family MFS transporter [Rhodanobacter sp. A1T4]
MQIANGVPDDAHAVHADSGLYIWLICLVAALGGLLFGYDWVVIGGAKIFYETYFGIHDPAMSGWLMSAALVGCIAGAAMAGKLADRFGRRAVLIVSAAVFLICALGTAWADGAGTFATFRIIGGLGIGLASSISPLYIAEVSPAAHRGRFVAINQFTIVVGVLLAQLVNLSIARPVPPGLDAHALLQSWNVQHGWRWMFLSGGVPAVLFFVFAMVMPESPRWLSRRGRHDEAERVLMKIGGGAYARASLAAIRTVQDSTSGVRATWRDLLDRRVRPVAVIGVTLAVFQQWCGINVIFNYAQDIFASAGFDINEGLRSIVATGSVNLLFTLLALVLVDRWGRRKLMLIGAGGLFAVYLLIGGAYALHLLGLPVLLLVLAAIAIYATTLAPVTWVLLSEIFPDRIRAQAIAMSVFCLWTACFVLTYTFPWLNTHLGPAGSFWLYGLICGAGFLFVLRRVPETAGIPLEVLEARLERRTDVR